MSISPFRGDSHMCIQTLYKSFLHVDDIWILVKPYIYGALYIHGKSRNVKYWHVKIIYIVFKYIDANLHETDLSPISLDSIDEHYYRNATTLKFAIISRLI